ncbi:MAG: bifunctional 5,10-methylenetetrahydrofolate dehydrogenase/5,10-methenyltetrahydrofolate cyclohydrolase [Planctomycetota bacterium]
MTAVLIYGEPLADAIRRDIRSDVEALAKDGIVPSLVAVQIGADRSSELYVKRQARDCRALGIKHRLDLLPADTTESGALEHIKKLNVDPAVNGIILQMPLPQGFDALSLQSAIDRRKDVEGIHPENLGRIVQGRIDLAPSTALAAFKLIRSTGIDLYGKEVVVVGHSQIVGRPMALMLLEEFSTVTVCHIGTRDISDYTRRADLLVVAAGVPGLIRGDMIKPGAFVVDIGINRVIKRAADGSAILDDKGEPVRETVGDVVFEDALKVAGYLTPVPGGVGPLTVTMLLKNIVSAATWMR